MCSTCHAISFPDSCKGRGVRPKQCNIHAPPVFQPCLFVEWVFEKKFAGLDSSNHLLKFFLMNFMLKRRRKPAKNCENHFQKVFSFPFSWHRLGTYKNLLEIVVCWRTFGKDEFISPGILSNRVQEAAMLMQKRLTVWMHLLSNLSTQYIQDMTYAKSCTDAR